MAKNNGIISAPINVVSDVARVLGVNSSDIGYLCRNVHRKINPLSKYKPIRCDKKGTLSDLDFKSNDWGYHIPKSTGLNTIIQAFKDNIIPTDWIAPATLGTFYLCNGWWWEPPTGGKDTPYRITDFNSYNHYESRQLMELHVNEKTLTDATSAFRLYITFPLGLDFSYFGSFTAYNSNDGENEDGAFEETVRIHLGMFCTHEESGTTLYTSVLDTENADPSLLLDNDGINKFFPIDGTYNVNVFATNVSYQNYDSSKPGYNSSPTAILIAFPLPLQGIKITKNASPAINYVDLSIRSFSIIKQGLVYMLKLSLEASNLTGSTYIYLSSKTRIKYYYFNDKYRSDMVEAAFSTDNSSIAVGATDVVYDGMLPTDIHHNTQISGLFYVRLIVYYENSKGEDVAQDERTAVYSDSLLPIL